jgi:hypothetical protein
MRRRYFRVAMLGYSGGVSPLSGPPSSPRRTRPTSMASKGSGPRYAKFGRHVRYRLSDVIDWERERLPREKRSTA